MSLPRLPFVATPQNRWWWAVGVGTYATLIYALSGWLAQGLEPRVLPFSALDSALPFVPESFWVYSSIYLIYFVSCALQRDMHVFSRFMYGYVLAYSLSAILFLCYPTTFPRADYPLPGDLDPWTRTAFGWLRATDAPTNCLPSMHVVSAVMSTLPFYGKRPRLFIFFSIWATAISVATLTTKQHYAVDVPTGALFGILSYVVALKWPLRGTHVLEVRATNENAALG